MFDDMGINTKIITSNSYVKMAAETQAKKQAELKGKDIECLK